MSRIPASAGVVLAGLLPACAAALGLGEVESRSFLNQPLAAEIPVFSDSPGELTGLEVSLAPAGTFAQYGLQRPAFLGDLAFSVVPGSGGAVIRITSAQPVVEPFVTLLLEVRWPQGRLLREYTVLLDPPAFTGGAVQQPVQAPTAAPRPATPPPAAMPEATPATGSAPLATTGGGDGTHTVARSETLWAIAERYRPEGAADLNQVMVAIYRANPDAFAGNINRLNAGAQLRIPGSDAVAAIGRGEAAAEVRSQIEAWQGAAPAAAPARLELVPPTETPAARAPAEGRPAPGAAATGDGEEARRLLAVKDAELQALRQRVAELERQAEGDVAVDAEPEPAPAPEAPVEAAAEEPAAEEPAAEAPVAADEAPAADATAQDEPAKPAGKQPVRAKPAREEGGGIVATITGLLTSIWLWGAAAVVLVGALLLARRRGGSEADAPWRPTVRRGPGGDAEATTRTSADDSFVVEEGKAQSTGGFERRSRPRGDEESPLERTISTDGPVNLDQSDPLAEADFHMAYGLYDQAADLLTAAIGREPARRDLQLKLLDVFFVWENRDAFLKEARALRARIGDDNDPDWKRVAIIGKQLCPDDPLFAGAVAPAAEDVDLAFTGESADTGTLDLPLVDDSGVIDFDLSEIEAEADADAPTKVAPRAWNSAQTQEIPTVELSELDSVSTMETPTIESPRLSSTLETPTLESPMAEGTLETPTIETTMADGMSGTARLQGIGAGEERGDQTAEIDLEELGLDLTGLDDAARDLGTGLQKALPEMGSLDLDLSDAGTGGSTDLDLTGEIAQADQDPSPTLGNLTRALGKQPGESLVEDTAEQPAFDDDEAGATRSSPLLGATSSELEALNIDFDLGAPADEASDLTATGLRAISPRRPEDPTMTEVGTKLDLARAYVDMGDPEGARSILNEVLEEGDQAQRQEARQLLDGLDG